MSQPPSNIIKTFSKLPLKRSQYKLQTNLNLTLFLYSIVLIHVTVNINSGKFLLKSAFRLLINFLKKSEFY